MKITDAINELEDYVAENDKLTISIEAITMARKALELQNKLEDFFNNAKTNYDKGLTVAIKKICKI